MHKQLFFLFRDLELRIIDDISVYIMFLCSEKAALQWIKRKKLIIDKIS